MKTLATGAIWLVWIVSVLGAEPSVDAPSEAEQRERLFQRFLAETRESGMPINMDTTNLAMSRFVFNGMVVHPSFGLRWDEVPPPTLTDSSAMAGVNAFSATNGWNMHSNRLIFSYGLDDPHPIRGLPWEVIKDREFPALTHRGVLYVILSGWHHDVSGVAYNPSTNTFAAAITGFKPIGGHWYAWAQLEDQVRLPQLYEGSWRGEPGGAFSGSPPIRSETNRSSSAAASRRSP